MYDNLRHHQAYAIDFCNEEMYAVNKYIFAVKCANYPEFVRNLTLIGIKLEEEKLNKKEGFLILNVGFFLLIHGFIRNLLQSA